METGLTSSVERLSAQAGGLACEGSPERLQPLTRKAEALRAGLFRTALACVRAVQWSPQVVSYDVCPFTWSAFSLVLSASEVCCYVVRNVGFRHPAARYTPELTCLRTGRFYPTRPPPPLRVFLVAEVTPYAHSGPAALNLVSESLLASITWNVCMAAAYVGPVVYGLPPHTLACSLHSPLPCEEVSDLRAQISLPTVPSTWELLHQPRGLVQEWQRAAVWDRPTGQELQQVLPTSRGASLPPSLPTSKRSAGEGFAHSPWGAAAASYWLGLLLGGEKTSLPPAGAARL